MSKIVLPIAMFAAVMLMFPVHKIRSFQGILTILVLFASFAVFFVALNALNSVQNRIQRLAATDSLDRVIESVEDDPDSASLRRNLSEQGQQFHVLANERDKWKRFLVTSVLAAFVGLLSLVILNFSG